MKTKQQNEFKTHAVLGLSNWGGIAIMLNETGEAIRWRWYDRKPTKRWQEIKWLKSGEPFVVIRGRRYRLDEFMRV